MNHKSTFIFVLTNYFIFYFTLPSFAQKNYEPGYIVTTQGDTLKGYIDNKDWRKNPETIHFRKSIDSDNTVEYKPAQLTSFYLKATNEQYVGAIVDMDQLPVTMDKLIEVATDAEFFSKVIPIRDTVFLRTLVSGVVNLYMYEDSKVHFFVQNKHAKIEELVFQRYILSNVRLSRQYDGYKKQLTTYMTGCSTIEQSIGRSLYLESDLTRLFEKYNRCVAPEIVQVQKREKIKFTPGVIGGLSITNLIFEGSSALYLTNVNFSSSTKPYLGVSLNISLPRGLHAWSLYNELGLKSYHVNGIYNEESSISPDYAWNVDLNFAYIKLSNLARYTYPKGLVRPFINLGISNALAVKTENKAIEETHAKPDKNALSTLRKHEQGWIGGIGILMKKWSVEARYEQSNGMSNYNAISSKSNSYYLLLGFRF
ncbi:outer membrane beta-barrel protein [Xanthocytophaga agilis]|uniref:Outer membrane protein beta-barrel domain-containing protein n=1 Tax=Xanthocytophaga agilis TaxID=3048010 RepID=A0AAE3QZS7_9BACT|nr:hypothetical protein [Xanthocytophaga agilis]MDJ1499084.1 hypothetical protein [Xanthocytophaga agilis]